MLKNGEQKQSEPKKKQKMGERNRTKNDMKCSAPLWPSVLCVAKIRACGNVYLYEDVLRIGVIDITT